jgi:ectoine hydroxylase-related dioxygenase (phytanoyl-CoA dioxygenase family)
VSWDTDTSKLPQPLRVQGVIYLTDTTPEMGGFTCIPGFIGPVLEEWIARQPADRDPRRPDLATLPPGCEVTPIPGKAGDLVIWSTLLAHGNGHNVSDRPRFAQYVTMFPAPEGERAEAMREDRVMRWQKRLAPDTNWVVGDPRRKEELEGKTAELTPLGRKLLGADPWA